MRRLREIEQAIETDEYVGVDEQMLYVQALMQEIHGRKFSLAEIGRRYRDIKEGLDPDANEVTEEEDEDEDEDE